MSSQFLSVLSTAWRVTLSRFLPLYTAFLATYGIIILLLWTMFKAGSPFILLILTGFILLLLSCIPTLVACHQLGSRLMNASPTIAESLMIALQRYFIYFIADFVLILPYAIGLLLLLFAILLWMSSLFPLIGAVESQIPVLASLTTSFSHSLMLTFIVAIAFLIWGIYLSIRAALCAPVAVMEKLSIMGTIRRTKILVKGKWWWTATILFICPLLGWTMQALAHVIESSVTAHLVTDSMSAIIINGLIYGLIIMPFIQLFFAGVVTALWQNLTLRENQSTVLL